MDSIPLHIETPLIESQFLHNKFGKNFYFKLEALQPSGSFKLRGIGRLCQHYKTLGVKQFVASSGGNAGIAVAYCGMKLNVPTKVFIPKTSHQIYIDEMQSYGANVEIAGNVWDDANQAAILYADKHNAAYIPPFDHPIIWDGHATIIDEIVKAGVKPDVIVAAVGGGGLMCGILEGLERHALNQVELIAVETSGADAFHQSLLANQLVTLDKITSKATSLGVKRVAKRLFEWSKVREIKSVVVSDAEADAGALAFAKDKRILVEIAAGAPLSLVYTNHPILAQYQSVLVIVCGGINT